MRDRGLSGGRARRARGSTLRGWSALVLLAACAAPPPPPPETPPVARRAPRGLRGRLRRPVGARLGPELELPGDRRRWHGGARRRAPLGGRRNARPGQQRPGGAPANARRAHRRGPRTADGPVRPGLRGEPPGHARRLSRRRAPHEDRGPDARGRALRGGRRCPTGDAELPAAPSARRWRGVTDQNEGGRLDKKRS